MQRLFQATQDRNIQCLKQGKHVLLEPFEKTWRCVQKIWADSEARQDAAELRSRAVRQPASHEAWSSRLKRHSVYTPAACRLTFPRIYLSTPRERRGAFKCKCRSPCERRPCRRRVITRGETNLSGYFSLITDSLLHCGARWMASSHYYLKKKIFGGFFSYRCETLVYYVDVQYLSLPDACFLFKLMKKHGGGICCCIRWSSS